MGAKATTGSTSPCRLEIADPPGAYDAYLRALACDPEHVETTINIGRMCSDGGDLKRASAYFRNAVRIDPTHPVAHFNLAVTLHDLSDWDGADAAYRAALAHDQSFADAHFNLAALLEQRGKRDEALAHLKAYDDVHKDRRASACRTLQRRKASGGKIFREETRPAVLQRRCTGHVTRTLRAEPFAGGCNIAVPTSSRIHAAIVRRQARLPGTIPADSGLTPASHFFRYGASLSGRLADAQRT